MATTELMPPPDVVRPPVRSAGSWGFMAAAAILIAAHAPLLILHGEQIWLRPHYQFFPLAVLGAVVLAVTRLRGYGPLKPGSVGYALPLLTFAWLLLTVSELLYSSWLGAVAALVTLTVVLFAVGGARLVRRLLPSLVLLGLIIPPPFELDRQLILALQSLTARWASAVLDFLGVYHLMAGNVVEIGGRRLLVEEACSGVNSLFSLLACSLFFVFLVRRPPVHAIFLLTATVGWVLVANVARVVTVAYGTTYWGVDLAEGWRHEALGAAVFGVALALVWSTDRFLLFLLSPTASAVPRPASAVASSEGATASRKVPLAIWPVVAAYLLLLIAHFALYGGAVPEAKATTGPIPAVVEKLDADSLSARFEHWQRLGFAADTRNPGSAFGEFSKTWSYQNGQNMAGFSLDYPFPSWHDLTRCYTGQGWTMDEQAVHKPAPPPNPPPAAGEGGAGADQDGYVAVRFTKPGFRSGYLLFCQFNKDGAPLDPRLGAAYLSVYRQEAALRHWWYRLQGAPDPTPAEPAPPVYQLQLFVESYTPLGVADRAAVEAFFLEGRRTLRDQWAASVLAQDRFNELFTFSRLKTTH
jgi:exosortase